MKLQELIKKINSKLDKGSLPARALYSDFKTGLGEPTVLQDDPTYLPFYYQLGRLVSCKNLIEFGFDQGMTSGSFIKGCPGVEKFLAFRKSGGEYYARRMGVSNIHSVLLKKFDLWVGGKSDPEFVKMVLTSKWDCVLISDSGRGEKEISSYLNLVWNQVAHGGLVAVDFLNEPPVRRALESFGEMHKKDFVVARTMRGTGLLQK